MTLSQIVKDRDFREVAEVKADAKHRVALARVRKSRKLYRVYENSLGQIILDPMVSIPASEAWVFESPAVIASIRRGLRQSAEGRTAKKKSMAKHAGDALD